MISFYLSPYSGSFLNQLNFIEENAWIYYITKFYIEDGFFTDFVDLKYYPTLLKKKEDIDITFIKKINKVTDVTNMKHIIDLYISNENYSINFEEFINSASSNIKHFIQIINRYNFIKIENNKEYSHLVHTTKSSTYHLHVTNNSEKSINIDINAKILYYQNISDSTILNNGHLFYYVENKKIEN